jgi:hypothetical protein
LIIETGVGVKFRSSMLPRLKLGRVLDLQPPRPTTRTAAMSHTVAQQEAMV